MPGSFVEVEYSFQSASKPEIAEHLARIAVAAPRIGEELAAAISRHERPANLVAVQIATTGGVVLHWMDVRTLQEVQLVVRLESGEAGT